MKRKIKIEDSSQLDDIIEQMIDTMMSEYTCDINEIITPFILILLVREKKIKELQKNFNNAFADYKKMLSERNEINLSPIFDPRIQGTTWGLIKLIHSIVHKTTSSLELIQNIKTEELNYSFTPGNDDEAVILELDSKISNEISHFASNYIMDIIEDSENIAVLVRSGRPNSTTYIIKVKGQLPPQHVYMRNRLRNQLLEGKPYERTEDDIEILDFGATQRDDNLIEKINEVLKKYYITNPPLSKIKAIKRTIAVERNSYYTEKFKEAINRTVGRYDKDHTKGKNCYIRYDENDPSQLIIGEFHGSCTHVQSADSNCVSKVNLILFSLTNQINDALYFNPDIPKSEAEFAFYHAGISTIKIYYSEYCHTKINPINFSNVDLIVVCCNVNKFRFTGKITLTGPIRGNLTLYGSAIADPIKMSEIVHDHGSDSEYESDSANNEFYRRIDIANNHPVPQIHITGDLTLYGNIKSINYDKSRSISIKARNAFIYMESYSRVGGELIGNVTVKLAKRGYLYLDRRLYIGMREFTIFTVKAGKRNEMILNRKTGEIKYRDTRVIKELPLRLHKETEFCPDIHCLYVQEREYQHLIPSLLESIFVTDRDGKCNIL